MPAIHIPTRAMMGYPDARDDGVRRPARLDAAHVGFVFADEIWNGHCGTRVRTFARAGIGAMFRCS